MTSVVIPIKELDQAKSRLSYLLPESARAALVLAMLKDLLEKLSSIQQVTTYVVGKNDLVSSITDDYGARFIEETVVEGYNAAVRRGLSAIPFGPVAVIPGDVPLATAPEIEALIGTCHTNSDTVHLSPDCRRSGTNGFYLSSPRLLDPRFGPNSFSRHKQAAKQANLACKTLILPGLARDIDTPVDLLYARCLISKGHFHGLLNSAEFSYYFNNCQERVAC